MSLFVVGWNGYLVVYDCGLFVVFVLFGFGFVLFGCCWLFVWVGCCLLFVICYLLV